MSETFETVDLHFNVAVAGKARRGQDVLGVERTPYVDGLLEHGIASIVTPDVSGLAPVADIDAAGENPRVPAGPDTTPSGTAPQDLPIGASLRQAADAAAAAAGLSVDATDGGGEV